MHRGRGAGQGHPAAARGGAVERRGAELSGERLDVLLVGYFPPQGAIDELFRQLALSLAARAEVGVLAPDHVSGAVGDAAELVFPYSSRRPDRAVSGRGARAHRAAAARRPRSVLLFTQHPLNAWALRNLGHEPRVSLWWHEPDARGQAGRARRALYASHDRIVVPRCDAFVVASPSVRERVPAELRPRTAVVPFPYPQEFDEVSSRFESAPSDLVFFGKLAPYKGLDVLAGALAQLASRGLRPRLRVVGAGSLEQAAPALAAWAHGAPQQFDHVAEYASAADISSAIDAARVVVLPYLTAAGSSTVAIVGARDRALAASATGSFADHLTHGTDALLHRPGDVDELADQLADLLGSADRRAALGAALGAMCRGTFAPSAVAERLLSVLERPAAADPTGS